ncbi:hypothetical protein N9W79_02585, partial [bacterium]|nr:hypothetical protein [bacterium]
LCSGVSSASTLPRNNLHLLDNPAITANISKSKFNSILDNVETHYRPIVEAQYGYLDVKRYWSSSVVNATAERDGDDWIVNMYGGMARRPEMTPDGFTLVVCHELGHHLGGFPQITDWGANEGQSDYFATHACAKKLWRSELSINATFRSSVDSIAKSKCDETYGSTEDQNLCYRISKAGESLAGLLAVLQQRDVPSFATPSTETVKRTNNRHPEAQCRLDTYIAGALCTTAYDDFLVPGQWGSRYDAELEAIQVSCSQFQEAHVWSAKPRCWYAQRVDDTEL